MTGKTYLVIRSIILCLALAGTFTSAMSQEYQLVWADEFNSNGKPDPVFWSFEEGFKRNHELQWYQSGNAHCKDGVLVIEAKQEKRKSPVYEAGSTHWARSREHIEVTSSSINTAGKKEFLYGRFEVKARIPIAGGAWPAIWTLGTDMEWPSNGEIDIMEYYRIKSVPHILANAAWGTEQQYNAKWNSKAIPFTYFTDKNPDWASKFHIWRMDWDETSIKLYLDDELLNEISLSETINGSLGKHANPFKQPHYLLLNLAIGGDNGGEPDFSAFPMKYEIDYVRVYQKKNDKMRPAQLWLDNNGEHINAHGGGVLFHEGKYYWFGEHKSEKTSAALVGVTCYSSTDLLNWVNEGVALPVSNDPNSDITSGSVIERPKVIYNPKTGKFVMWFHLELKGKGYEAALAGMAISDTPAGPYTYVRSGRVNPGIYPENMSKKDRKAKTDPKMFEKWWTPEWSEAVNEGLFVKRDLEGGQMSRDMTLYVDDDGTAYHIYSSEENLTLHIAELTDDYQSHTGRYIRIFPGGHNEAPAIFKKDDIYWMITSGCTGWDPNEARMFSAPSIWGPWTQHPNPCVGPGAELTFGGQSTYILPLPGKDQFIFMADMWRPKHPIDARYIWLPIQFDETGTPVIEWKDEWEQELTDREYWCNLLYRMAEPVLSNMSEGKLKENMQVEVSPNWDGRNKDVTYMEAFGRLMMGLAPWLSLPDDDTPEGLQRKQLRQWALKSYAHAVNPESKDYLLWNKHGQALVDASFIASSFLRAPKQLWEPLDDITKQRYVKEFQGLRRFTPVYSNWILFVGTIETFLMSIGEEYDAYRIDISLRKTEEWYVGDGWYSDGPGFAFDYYNSFVIQPMYVEILQALYTAKKSPRVNEQRLERGMKRMQRFGEILERMISPEGSFPIFGRSMTYRTGAFQALTLLAWQEKLPKSISEGQVRAGLTAIKKRMFADPSNFNEKGFLQLGFVGHQPELADVYTNNGSLYLTSFSFLPLGLPANHSFWTSPAEPWTSKKAWEGMGFSKDKAYHE